MRSHVVHRRWRRQAKTSTGRFGSIIAVLFAGTSLCGASPSAAVDLTGAYLIVTSEELGHFCRVTVTQAGTDLSMTGACDSVGNIAVAGTVDVGTGAFVASGQAETVCADPGSLSISGDGDGTTLSGTVTCGSSFIFLGSKCGNGLSDTGEECDDGNRGDGDCCSSTCHVDAPGSSCRSDYNTCTDDVCDDAGTCLHLPNTGPCDDGNQCTTGESCNASGACSGGAPCDPCSFCTPYGCFADLDSDQCATNSGRSRLKVETRDPDDRDVVVWSWLGELHRQFGDPTASTNYRFCAYAFDTTSYRHKTIAFADMPAGSEWMANSSGFKFQSSSTKAQLRTGRTRARIKVRGRGANLGVPASLEQYALAPVGAPVMVRVRADDGQCWAVDFDALRKHTPTLIKADTGR